MHLVGHNKTKKMNAVGISVFLVSYLRIVSLQDEYHQRVMQHTGQALSSFLLFEKKRTAHEMTDTWRHIIIAIYHQT